MDKIQFFTDPPNLLKDAAWIWIASIGLYFINQWLVHGIGALFVVPLITSIIYIILISLIWAILCVILIVISLRVMKSRQVLFYLSVTAVFIQFYIFNDVSQSGNVGTQFGPLHENHHITLAGVAHNLLQPIPFLAVYSFYLLKKKPK